MDTLPSELLADLTRRLSLTHVARLARTCKENYRRIWTFVTQLTLQETKKIGESTQLSKFNNLTSLHLDRNRPFPQDLSNLTTLQKIGGIDPRVPEALALSKLTNLTELLLNYARSEQHSASLEDLLKNHTRLKVLSVSGFKLQSLDPLSWQFLTRIHQLSLYEYSSQYDNDALDLSKVLALTQLRDLSLGTIKQTAMLTGLSKLLNLERLSIYASESKNNGRIVDYNELLTMSRLTELSIIFTDVDAGMQNVFAKLTQLERFELVEDKPYQIGIYSNLTNLKYLGLLVHISSADQGLNFTNMTKLENISIPWCHTVTQLKNLKHLQELSISHGNEDEHNGLLFLQDLHSLQRLSVSAQITPNNGRIELNGLTRLNYIDIFVEDYAKDTRDFIRCLTALQCLTKLSLRMFDESLLPIVSELPHLRLLVVPGRSIVPNQSNYPFLFEFTSI